MKNSTLAAAVLVSGLIGFIAPNAQAFPQGKQQINAEQAATVTSLTVGMVIATTTFRIMAANTIGAK